jgi:hypothetical protein
MVFAQMGETANDLGPSLLHRVLGTVLVSQQTPCMRSQLSVPASHQQAEGASVP